MKNKFLICFIFTLFVSFVITEIVLAKKVTIKNYYHKTVSVAFRYKDKSIGWVTRGWYPVRPKTQTHVDFNSKNIIFYIYAEATDGRKWRGSDRYFTVVPVEKFTLTGQRKASGGKL